MGAKPELAKETDCMTDERNGSDVSQSESASSEQPIDLDVEDVVKKMLLRRLASPRIIVNKNGSRFISPLEIVRSDAGRAEIERQTRRGSSERTEKIKPQERDVREKKTG